MKLFDIDSWEEIWATITKNKWRSFFTAMGVFWGVFMLIIMLGAGRGLEGMLMQQIGGFSVNSAFFYTRPTSLAYKGFRSGRSWNFRESDLDAIKNNVPGIQTIAGICMGRSVNIIHGEKEVQYSTIGQMPQYAEIDPQILLYGRYINDVDMLERRKVCILGVQVYKELFNLGENPVGKIIKVGNSYFTVIGVNEPPGSTNMFVNSSRSVIIPFSTMQQMYNRGDIVDYLAVTGKPDVDVSLIENGIYDLLRSRYDISPEDTKAIAGFNVKERFDMFKNLFTGIGLLTWIVGIGTLLAGIVGISNIMLVVVRERTQEIGVRRALGAPPWAIITQIMCESFVLTFIAGVIALTLSVGILSIADSILAAQAAQNAQMNPGQSGPTFSAQISFGLGMAALGVVLAGGLLAGIIPAIRAMGVSPVDAIREE